MTLRMSPLVPAAVLLASTAFATSSFGQSPEGSRSAAERAKQFFDEGNALYDQGKLKEAEAAYQSAWNAHRSHYIAANLGNVEMLVGQHCDALEHLTFARDDFPPIGKPEDKQRLIARLEEEQHKVGFLEVTVDVAGAEVRVDGKPVGRSPLNKTCVEPGTRTVEALRAGYDGEPKTIRIKAKSRHLITLHLTPKPRSFFAGKNAPLLVAGSALTIAGLGLGIGTAIDANAKSKEKEGIQEKLVPGQCKNAQPLCDDLDTTLRTIDTSTNLSIAGFTVAGAAAVATSVYLLWPSSAPDDADSTLTLSPILTGEVGGLLINGQF